MKTDYLRNKIGGAILGFSLLFGITIMSSMTAQAQYRNDDYYRRNSDYERDQRRRDRDEARDQRRRDNDRDRRRDDGYSNYGGSYELRQTALNAGYNEGLKEGRKDRSHGDRFDYQDEGAYQSATKDYSSRLGDRRLYQEYFRQAFANGYSDGYRRY